MGESFDVRGGSVVVGAVVTGALDGRTGDEEVTVFDSTWLAIQDVTAAHAP